MSSITILTEAVQTDVGAGTAVDVSTFSTIRLNWSAKVDTGRKFDLELVIEAGPAANGPWQTIYQRHMACPGSGSAPFEHAPRVVLSGFDSFVRARWSGQTKYGHNETPNSFFTLGLAGDGQPNAA